MPVADEQGERMRRSTAVIGIFILAMVAPCSAAAQDQAIPAAEALAVPPAKRPNFLQRATATLNQVVEGAVAVKQLSDRFKRKPATDVAGDPAVTGPSD